jgi:hypothetical protein
MTDTTSQNRNAKRIVGTLSLVVLGLVILLNNLPQQSSLPWFVPWLPRLNATLNAICTVLLLLSWRMIRLHRIDWHKKPDGFWAFDGFFVILCFVSFLRDRNQVPGVQSNPALLPDDFDIAYCSGCGGFAHGFAVLLLCAQRSD